jgi:hypothetical protein
VRLRRLIRGGRADELQVEVVTMTYGITLAFEGVDEDQYWAVNGKLGINRDGSGDWPPGLLVHSAGATPTGWVVSEVWESSAAQHEFMAGRLGAALAAVGIGEPSQVIESMVVNVHST